MRYIFYVLVFIVGAIFGSFLCCQARRFREREQKKKKLPSRSICMHCKYQLKWYDNISIISWLLLRGRCRKCKAKIGAAEIISELACALALLLLSIDFNPETAGIFAWLTYAFRLMLTLSLCFLAIYDGLYGELPNFAFFIAGAFALALVATAAIETATGGTFAIESLTYPALSALFFGGIYLVLYLISKGKWVGDGDWLLAGIIGLALGSVWLSAIALFIANFSACLIMFPAVKKSKNSKIHFGPFLVLAYVITASFATFFQSMI